MLTFGCPISDLALAANFQRILQSMMRFTLVQSDVGSALHSDIERPFDDKQRPFDPSDFRKSNGQIVLAQVRGQLLQLPAWRHLAGKHRCGTTKHVRPVVDDCLFPDFVSGQTFQFLWDVFGIKDVQALGFQVANSGVEKVSGCFRTEKGIKNYCILRTITETGRKQGRGTLDTLRAGPAVFIELLEIA